VGSGGHARGREQPRELLAEVHPAAPARAAPASAGTALEPAEARRDIRLRPFRPSLERMQLRRAGGPRAWFLWFPWQPFFDPVLPWLYPLKRRYRLLARRQSYVVTLGILLLTTFAAAISMSMGKAWSAPKELLGWSCAYSLLLTSAWLLPVPYVVASWLAAIHLGEELGLHLAVAALWVASTLGYGLSRAFPTTAARFFRRTGPRWLPDSIGLRRLPTVVSAAIDPRVSVRSKIAFQGLYCVPFPWFALGMWALLPAALYVGCRWAVALTPASMLDSVRSLAPLILAGLAVFTAGRLYWRLERADRKAASRRPA
jgi:hypothetical protein